LKAKKGDLDGAMDSYQKAMRSYESMKLPGQMLHMTVDYIPVFVEAGRKAEIVKIFQRLKKDYKDKGITYLLEKLERAEKELLGDG